MTSFINIPFPQVSVSILQLPVGFSPYITRVTPTIIATVKVSVQYMYTGGPDSINITPRYLSATWSALGPFAGSVGLGKVFPQETLSRGVQLDRTYIYSVSLIASTGFTRFFGNGTVDIPFTVTAGSVSFQIQSTMGSPTGVTTSNTLQIAFNGTVTYDSDSSDSYDQILQLDVSNAGQKFLAAPGFNALVSQPVAWQYKVTSRVPVQFFNLSINDNVGTMIRCPNTTIDDYDSKLCTATVTAELGLHSAVACASVMLANGLKFYSKYDTWTYTGYQPGIDVTAYTQGRNLSSGVMADSSLPYLLSGDSVVWTYVVSNTGTCNLQNVMVSDNAGITPNCPTNSLAIGVSMTCSATGVVQATGFFSNVASARGVCGIVVPAVGEPSASVSDISVSGHYGVPPCPAGTTSPNQHTMPDDCLPLDACTTNHGGCDVHASCSSTGPYAANVTCTCTAGYQGSGYGCGACEAINDCATSNGGCDSHATCTSTGPDQHSCACNAGYSTVGMTCVLPAVNSCSTANGGCDYNALCNNTGPLQGDRTCTCNRGFTGTAYGCGSCLFVNACGTANGGCDSNAACNSTGPGRRSCTCAPGYDDVNNNGTLCVAIDACMALSPCIDAFGGGNCTVTGPGTFRCSCVAGWIGNGIDECQPVNACSLNNGGCDVNAFCQPTGPATRACTCLPGHAGLGDVCGACTAINLCATDNGGCSTLAFCNFTGPSTRDCRCNEGYAGSGVGLSGCSQV